MDARRGARRKGHDSIVIRWQEDEKFRHSQTSSWMDRGILPIPGPPHDDRHLVHRTLAPEALVRKHHHAGIDDRQAGLMRARKNPSPLRNLSQVFDKNKDDRIPFFPRTREYGKDHSTKHCEQTWNGTARIGKPTGRKLPLHHLHNNGGNTNTKTRNGANTKTLNGEILIGGKSDGYRLFQSHVGFFHRFRVLTLFPSECRADRSPRRTQRFSQCRAHLTITRVCGSRLKAQDFTSQTFGTCCSSAHRKSHPLTACFIDHSSTCLTHFHHFVPRHLLPHRQHCL